MQPVTLIEPASRTKETAIKALGGEIHGTFKGGAVWWKIPGLWTVSQLETRGVYVQGFKEDTCVWDYWHIQRRLDYAIFTAPNEGYVLGRDAGEVIKVSYNEKRNKHTNPALYDCVAFDKVKVYNHFKDLAFIKENYSLFRVRIDNTKLRYGLFDLIVQRDDIGVNLLGRFGLFSASLITELNPDGEYVLACGPSGALNYRKKLISVDKLNIEATVYKITQKQLTWREIEQLPKERVVAIGVHHAAHEGSSGLYKMKSVEIMEGYAKVKMEEVQVFNVAVLEPV
jgi:hypothetical protein